MNRKNAKRVNPFVRVIGMSLLMCPIIMGFSYQNMLTAASDNIFMGQEISNLFAVIFAVSMIVFAFAAFFAMLFVSYKLACIIETFHYNRKKQLSKKPATYQMRKSSARI